MARSLHVEGTLNRQPGGKDSVPRNYPNTLVKAFIKWHDEDKYFQKKDSHIKSEIDESNKSCLFDFILFL